MKKGYYLLIFICVTVLIQAQEVGKKVETKYLRPSISTIIAEPGSRNEFVITDKLKEIDMNVKFDDHRINIPYDLTFASSITT
ncbi:MAG: hypothetical protein PHS59_17680 [Paludibacter sp.]|nr:hypothetical protein [Paludibacter sp.]